MTWDFVVVSRATTFSIRYVGLLATSILARRPFGFGVILPNFVIAAVITDFDVLTLCSRT
jgi:hypothetical protein